MLLMLASIVGVVAVVAALLRGGRFERLVALILTAANAVRWIEVASWIPREFVTGRAGVLIWTFNASLALAALAWLAWVRRARWVYAVLGLSAAIMAVYLYARLHPGTWAWLHDVYNGLTLARSLCLGWAVLRYNLAPPTPAPGEAAFDARRAARSEGL
jgi:hypothetical protein